MSLPVTSHWIQGPRPASAAAAAGRPGGRPSREDVLASMEKHGKTVCPLETLKLNRLMKLKKKYQNDTKCAIEGGWASRGYLWQWPCDCVFSSRSTESPALVLCSFSLILLFLVYLKWRICSWRSLDQISRVKWSKMAAITIPSPSVEICNTDSLIAGKNRTSWWRSYCFFGLRKLQLEGITRTSPARKQFQSQPF